MGEADYIARRARRSSALWCSLIAIGGSKRGRFADYGSPRISAAAKINGISYSQLIKGLKQARVELDRKILAEIAVADMAGFGQIAQTAKSHLRRLKVPESSSQMNDSLEALRGEVLDRIQQIRLRRGARTDTGRESWAAAAALRCCCAVMKDMPAEERPRRRRSSSINCAATSRSAWTSGLAPCRSKPKRRRSADERIDITLPGTRFGSAAALHPLTLVIDEIIDIFWGMGFEIARGPDIEDDYHNFEALNIPKDHPARDMQDTFFVSTDDC